MIRNEIGFIGLGKVAADLRRVANEVESGNLIAAAFVTCDHEGYITTGSVLYAKFGTPELIDEMVDRVKTELFESLDDQIIEAVTRVDQK